MDTPVYDRYLLRRGGKLEGPAIGEEKTLASGGPRAARQGPADASQGVAAAEAGQARPEQSTHEPATRPPRPVAPTKPSIANIERLSCLLRLVFPLVSRCELPDVFVFVFVFICYSNCGVMKMRVFAGI